MAKTFLILAVLFAILGAIAQALAARAGGTSSSSRALAAGYVSAAAVFAAGWILCLWFAQQRYSRQWNSRPILDIRIDSEKRLILNNRGLVDIEDVSARFTEYQLSEDYAKHISKATLLWYGVMGGLYAVVERVEAGNSTMIDLKSKSPLVKFYSVLPQPADTWQRSVYCFRLTFRNSVTKQRFVRYVLTSPSVVLPDPWSASEKVAMSGSVDLSGDVMKLRDAIRAHQASFFEDQPDEFFRN
jgi:hypothetical protein